MSIKRRIKKLEDETALSGDRIIIPVIVYDPFLELSEEEIREIEDEQIKAEGLTRDKVKICRIIVLTPPFPPEHHRFKTEPFDPYPHHPEMTMKEKMASVRRHKERDRQKEQDNGSGGHRRV